MAIVATDWTVSRSTGNIRYIGNDHNGAAPSYATVIEFHRWLQGLADDAVSSGDDELDITDEDPSARSTDNIIRLKGLYNIDDTAAEHLYDGSIIQGAGGTEVIYDGIVNYGNADVMIQLMQAGAVLADDWWNYSVGGTHTGAADASVLTDSGKTWTVNQWVGYTIKNTTDGSSGIITANTSNTITATLAGGTENDWDNGDAYLIASGLNPDASQGISHRFMVKVRTAGADTDGRRLIGSCRRLSKTYAEFPINGTSRGNNVLALTDGDDLNNTTAQATIASWNTITNLTEGFAQLDVDANGTPENYIGQWDRATFTINQLYERMKWLTMDGSSSTLYGLNGEVFRGITHEVSLGGGTPSGTFSAFEAVSWTGGTGQMLGIDNTTATSATKMWIQLLTGVAPTSGQNITGVSTAVAQANANATDRSSLLKRPFIGISTGSAIIGAYGMGIQPSDLTSQDKVFDLTNTQITPPNNQTFSVSGLVASEDQLIIGPWDGSTLDNEGWPAIDEDQLTLNTSLTTDNITAVVVTAAIPSDTPSTGWIRVQDNNGRYRRLHFSSWTGSTFTIDSTDGEEDFLSVNATAPKNVWIGYLDKTAGASTESFIATYNADRNLVVKVRDGGASPIKEYIASAVFSSTGGSVGATRIADT